MSPIAPYGAWDSPLSVNHVAAQRVSLSSLASDGEALWWLEGRPEEDGRVVLVRAERPGHPVVVSPEGTSIRSRVHEYGGGAWCLVGSSDLSSVAFVEERSQRIFVRGHDGVGPVALTPEAPKGERWCHGGLSAGPPGWLFSIRERHHEGGVERSVIALNLERPGDHEPVCAGRDFYGSVALSPDGTQVAWVTWDHPNMPWDETELWVGHLGSGCHVERPERIGVEELRACSVDQPVWLDDDRLVFVADREGWWQPWAWERSDGILPLCAREADFQGPAWSLGQHTVVALGAHRLGLVWQHDGVDHVGTLGLDGALHELEQPCVAITSLCTHHGALAWLGQTPTARGGVWLASRGRYEATRTITAAPSPLGAHDVSVAEPLSVPGAKGRQVHAHFYAPRREGWRAPDQSRPPLIVLCHGGPTGSAGAGFDPTVQMFTTRGFAVAAVNYAGSTGYGREYRRALEGAWGQADVDDCIAVATSLASSGRVEGTRMAIRGASAGGLTALGALARSTAFVAAVSWYGVSDLMGLVATTHDFESRYCDRLIGPLATSAQLYRERSPLHRVHDIDAAVLLLQGEDDPVVPAEQTRAMASALRGRGVRCEVRYFSGESHGFRRAETLVACLETELAFYRELLVEPLEPPS